MAKRRKKRTRASVGRKPEATTGKCGLCGKSGKLVKTECCGNWICDDYDKYVMFSYAHNSCRRNHDRYTLCGYHYQEGHSGHWKDCAKCQDAFETEMYVYYGTNDYNFEKIEEIPDYEPTRCAKCNRIINLSQDGFVMKGMGYYCVSCSDISLPRFG